SRSRPEARRNAQHDQGAHVRTRAGDTAGPRGKPALRRLGPATPFPETEPVRLRSGRESGVGLGGTDDPLYGRECVVRFADESDPGTRRVLDQFFNKPGVAFIVVAQSKVDEGDAR